MDINEFNRSIADVRNIFEPLLEVGVFKDDPASAREIAELLERAELFAQEKRIPEATTAMLLAEVRINEKVKKKSWLWRACYLHWLPLWAYYLVCLVLTLFLALVLPNLKLLDIPLRAILLGALGAELRGLYWLQEKVGERSFRPTSFVAHLSAPFIGGLLGILAHLIGGLGILVLTQQPSSAASSQGNLASLAVAFLSGFKWEWVVDTLDEKVFRSDKKPAGEA
jgi:uncharacterized membrane protein YvlD (DUF360 family)